METFKVFVPTSVTLAGEPIDLWPLYCWTPRAMTVNMALEAGVTATFQRDKSNAFSLEITDSGGERVLFEDSLLSVRQERVAPSMLFPMMVAQHYLSQKTDLPPGRYHIDVRFDAPQGGSSTTSALAIALLRGLSRLVGDFSDQGWQWEMLDWVRDIVARHLRLPTSSRECLASLFGGINSFSYNVGGAQRNSFPKGVFDEVSDRMMLFSLGTLVEHGLSEREFFANVISGNETFGKAVDSLAQLAVDLDGELRAGNLNWKYIGQCLTDTWGVWKSLYPHPSGRLNEIFQMTKRKYVYGAKICGPADDAMLVVLVDPACRSQFGRDCESQGIRIIHTQGCPKGVTVG